MKIRIRDWNEYFERDRSIQWKHLLWVPIPNKQGHGYRKIMSEKNGLEIFACWIALIQQGSLCSPRGDLSKYDLQDLSLLTLINEKYLKQAIVYLSETLDWIEVINNLDTTVPNLDVHGMRKAPDSSILSNSVQDNSIQDLNNKSLLDQRTEIFKNTVWDSPYPEEIKKEFFDYWSETNRSKTKMRFELQNTWDIKKRMNTWAARDNNFTNKKRFGRQEIPLSELKEQMERIHLT